MKQLMVLLTLLILVGCSLHQPARVEPPKGMPGAFSKGASAAGGPVASPWWRPFGDEQLDALLDRLFRSNLQLESGFARLEQARSLARAAGSRLWPSLNVAGSGQRSSDPGLSGRSQSTSLRLSAVASYEVDLWGRIKNQAAGAEAAALVTEEQLRTLYLSLAAQVCDLYFLSGELNQRLALVDATIANRRHNLELVENRYREGIASALEVYQARQSLQAAEAGRPPLIEALRQAENGLAVLVGGYAGEVQGASGLPADPGGLPATGVPADLLQRRPDLMAATARIRAADADIAAAIADRFPALSLTASAGRVRQDLVTGLIEGNFWSLLGSLSAPVFDAGRRRAEVDRSRAALREAVADYRQTVLTAFQEVENALVALEQDRQAVARLEILAATAQSSLDLARDSYREGLVDYLQVLDAERSLFDVRDRLLQVRRQVLSDLVGLGRALGGQWMDSEIEKRFTQE
ncbi:MAG: efflux transporter outer membrane subunit [Geothermobacteraceae bacterium]